MQKLLYIIIPLSILLLLPKFAAAGIIIRPVINTGLVGYWDFQEGAGVTAYDKSGKGNNGTWNGTGTTHWADGKIGKGGNFNGTDDYMDVADDVILNTDSVTVSAWVYVGNWTISSSVRQVVQYIFPDATPSGYYLALITGNGFAFGVNEENWGEHRASLTGYSTDTWYHVVGVYDNANSNILLYVNGGSPNETSLTGPINYADYPTNMQFQIGRDYSGGATRFFSGLIDEVRIYNRALSESEISRLYKLSSPKINASQNNLITDGLVGFWSFNGSDIDGTDAFDRSASGNHGTIIGATKTIGKVGQGLNFNGTSDYIRDSSTTGIPSGAAPITISAWFNRKEDKGTYELIAGTGSESISNAFGIDISDTDYLGCFGWTVGDDYYPTSPGTQPLNTWTHATCIYDGTNVILYKNGILIGSTVKSYSTVGNNFVIGASPAAGSYFFSGLIDEARVYNRALSAEEIQRLYKAGTGTVLAAQRCGDTIIDSRDGETYATVKIGSQCWMAQNMNIGTRIDGVVAQDGYSGTTCTSIDKYCYSDTDANCDSNNNPTYPDGGLYQWAQAMCGSTIEGAQGICPAGWHIPRDSELYTLERFLGTIGDCASNRSAWGCDPAGTKLKPGGSTGFEWNLSGYCSAGSHQFFSRTTGGGYFWSSSGSGSYTRIRYNSSSLATIYRFNDVRGYGYSVRCIKN